MGFELTIPNVKPKTIKDGVISVLSSTPNLSMKDIIFKIRKEYSMEPKYHAVYQSILELMSKGVVKREMLTYSINENWVDELEQYIDKMKHNYSKKTDVKLIDQNTTQLTFENMAEAAREGVNIMYSNYLDVFRTRRMYGQFQHIWPFHTANEKTIKFFKYAMKINKYFCLIRGNTIPDQRGMKFFNDMGVKMKIGVDCAERSNILVHGNAVAETFIPKNIMKKVDECFSKVEDKFDLDFFLEYNDIIRRRCKIITIITRNKLLADKIAEETMTHFTPKR